MLNRGSALFHENPPGAFAQFEGCFDLGDLGSTNAPYLRKIGDRGAIYAAEIVKGIQKADGEVHAPLVTVAGSEKDSEELVIREGLRAMFEKPLTGPFFFGQELFSQSLWLLFNSGSGLYVSIECQHRKHPFAVRCRQEHSL